jgi:CRP-like cAMP-binding protein
MLSAQSFLSALPVETIPTGTTLLQRSGTLDSVIFVERGRVVLGVLGSGVDVGAVEHQLGVVDGPGWLEASAAVLNIPSAVDAVAQTDVQLRRVPLNQFRACLDTCAPGVQSMMIDIAKAHRQQTEITVSRLAKDAEARCAEWLLTHAETGEKGACSVHLQQRKRAIAAQLGIAPETLSRVFRHLRELRLISGSGRIVDLVDPVGLRNLAGASAPCQCGIV